MTPKSSPPPPAHVDIKWMSEERAELYRIHPTPGRSTLVALDLLPVNDSLPEDDKVDGAVCHIRLERSGGPSGMKTEHLWSWMRADTRKELREPSKWDMVVGLIQAYFCEGNLVEECV